MNLPQKYKGRTALLVEDEPLVAKLIARTLSSMGFFVSVAGNLKAVEGNLRGIAIDLVVSDFFLPDGSGIDAIALVRDKNPSVAIILSTGIASTDESYPALEASGVRYVLRKPFTLAEFEELVAKALS